MSWIVIQVQSETFQPSFIKSWGSNKNSANSIQIQTLEASWNLNSKPFQDLKKLQ
jgi:hypothetical protein